MLGLGDLWVFCAYTFSIMSALLCIVYSFVNWNKDDSPVTAGDFNWINKK